jgi:hypothetical protein
MLPKFLTMNRDAMRSVAAVLAALLTLGSVVFMPNSAIAHEPQAPPTTETLKGHASLSEVGQKLSNPVSNVWAHFTEFDLRFSDGDLNRDDPEVSGAITYQPILPVPLTEDWKVIVRPTVPLLLGQPVPQGAIDSFDHEFGLGDSFLPMLLAPKLENWLLGLGPTFLLPTSTKDAFGSKQWGAGPAGILGYKNKHMLMGVFPQYFFGIGGRGDRGGKSKVSQMDLLYFAYLNLPHAWQIGFNPSISYNNKASSGNRWNVPVGLLVTKTIAMGGRPMKIQVGMEYSVVSEDAFGKRLLFKVNLIPVMAALIEKPIFGGH